MAKEQRSERVAIRLSPSFKRWIEARAEEDGRSLSSWIERALLRLKEEEGEEERRH